MPVLARTITRRTLTEAFTPGLAKALSRGGTRATCGCGMVIARYPGRYPKNCPACGKPLVAAPEVPTDDGGDDLPSTDEDDTTVLHQRLRANPDQYRVQVGKCPPGFHYGVNAKKCVSNRTVGSVLRHVGSDVKAAVRTLKTSSGRTSAIHAAGHTAKHVGKELLGLARLPIDAVTGAYKFAFKPKFRNQIVSNLSRALKTEAKETVAMAGTVAKIVSGKPTTREERIAAANQAVDIVKVAAATTIVGHWAAGGLAELAKELAMPWDDLAGSLVDKPLRTVTDRYFGSGATHGLLPSAFYKHHESIDEAYASQSVSDLLLKIASDAASQSPSEGDLRSALKGKVDGAKLEKFITEAKKRGLLKG